MKIFRLSITKVHLYPPSGTICFHARPSILSDSTIVLVKKAKQYLTDVSDMDDMYSDDGSDVTKFSDEQDCPPELSVPTIKQ